MSIPVYASASDIKVIVNGQERSFTPAPLIKDGSTLVPMRAFFEALGATVGWDGNTQTVTGKRDNTEVVLIIGQQEATVNGSIKTLSVPAQIIGGSTYIPLRFVGESLGDKVDWNNGTINIESSKDSLTMDSVSITFSVEDENLPRSIELIKPDQNNMNDISYIRYASDYIGSYSDIYLGNIQNQQVKETKIHSNSKDAAFIRNLKTDGEWAIWSDIYRDDIYYTDIYAYNFLDKKKVLVAEKVCSGVQNGYLDIHPNLLGDHIYWIDNNMQEGKTYIKSYDLNNNQVAVINSADFLDGFPQAATTALSAKNGKLIFDVRGDNGDYYYFYDINTNKVEKKIKIQDNVIVHFNCSYDLENNLLAVYNIRVDENDEYYEEVGYVDLNNGKYTKILTLNANEYLYDDYLQMDNGYMLFNVQQNISGAIDEHYAGYIVDVSKDIVEKLKGSFEIKQQGDYLTNLSFIKGEGLNKVKLEITKIR